MSEPTTRFSVGPRDGGKRLDRFLHERIPGLSRTRIQQAIRERVHLSWDVRARASTPVRPGGEVRVEPRVRQEPRLELQIEILDRGPGWLAVNKPAKLPVHPVHQVVENSLIRMLRRQLAEPGLRLAHRLDSETSGVLLVASSVEASRLLSAAFMNGEVDKEYLALVRGVVPQQRGSIELPIGPARDSRVWVRQQAGHGKPCRTEWEVERRFAHHTLLRLHPTTGRRHQLRVHLAAIGHPILGDMLYGRGDGDYLRMVQGRGDRREEDGGPTRQLLHSARLGFDDGSRRRVIEAPLPPDFILQMK